MAWAVTAGTRLRNPTRQRDACFTRPALLRIREGSLALDQALQLIALNDCLRGVLEGEPLSPQLGRMAVLLAWGAISFLIAQRLFRWN